MAISLKNDKTEDDSSQIDLMSKLCPFAVMYVIKEVDAMKSGQTLTFLVDDPLAIKSVPEELADYKMMSCKIKKIENGWAIIIAKNEHGPRSR